MDTLGLEKVHFDGCQYGLKSIKRGHEHEFVKKAWTFATNIPEVAARMGKCCHGQTPEHRHNPATGTDVLNTQYYTPEIAVLLHIAIKEHFRGWKHMIGYHNDPKNNLLHLL